MNIFDFVVNTHARRVANVRHARFNRLKLSSGRLNKLTFVQAMREAAAGRLAHDSEKAYSPYAGLFMERSSSYDS